MAKTGRGLKMLPNLIGFCIILYSGMMDVGQCAIPDCQITSSNRMAAEWIPMGEKLFFGEGEDKIAIPQAYCLKLKEPDVQH
jgi:hypothetical protein